MRSGLNSHYFHICWVWPPPRMPVVNEGLGWDPLLKMVHNPGGHCYWEGATCNVYVRSGLNCHYFHIIGDGHQPKSVGVYRAPLKRFLFKVR